MTGIIILAAGSSSRLGQAKQQLLFQGQTLLQRSIQAAVKAEGSPVIVVLGANAEAILPQLQFPETHLVTNPDWQEGMASSIRAGLNHLLSVAPQSSGALFMLCDQPFVSTNLLDALVQRQKKSGKNIVACSYQETLGAPVLFTKRFFSELLLLNGQEGAKKLLSIYRKEVASLLFPEGAIDIDTAEDYAALKQSQSK
ncbi:nucleotidyltransferase family protein [Rufibacter latericius]|uniref:Nucleotidyltransferase family protein n=1 Tax=Rufibacter latericius TaxID=2487040 RepID=A0A3M9N0C2_9BACT|nr:nucleotidyltransferase family protein [Rufibacter latericius]RNI30593.1 nucleotidyltransferase family protein [Rufibacter latericius]